jgi:sugar phosphate permease
LHKGWLLYSTGLGAGASNLLSGFVVQIFGYTIGFMTLAAIALGGLVFFALLMPETKPEESLGLEPPQGGISTPKPA